MTGTDASTTRLRGDAPADGVTDPPSGALDRPPRSAGGAAEERRPRSGAKSDAPLAVSVDRLSKVFVPYPMWMRVLLKSAIKEPVIALEDVSFQLERGEACVVIGPNGAGKSTLFGVLTGLILPTSGRTQILGHDVEEGRRVRSMIGYMPAEDRNLMLRHTCAQNLAFRGKLQNIPVRDLPDRIDETLDQVGILYARDRAAVSLSTGMRARLQLAAALLHRPEVLLLDEPTSAVDPVGAHELLTLIEDLTVESGLSIVLSSHRLEEIDALHNKVIFLDKGHVIHNGNLNDLHRVWEQPRYRIEFDGEVDPAQLGAKLEREADFEVDVFDGVLEIATERPVGAVMTAIGPALDAAVSFERVVMPMRVLFHKLVSGEIEGHKQ